MTEYERYWSDHLDHETESYTDYNNGCAMVIVNAVAILFVAALVGVLIWLVR